MFYGANSTGRRDARAHHVCHSGHPHTDQGGLRVAGLLPPRSMAFYFARNAVLRVADADLEEDPYVHTSSAALNEIVQAHPTFHSKLVGALTLTGARAIQWIICLPTIGISACTRRQPAARHITKSPILFSAMVRSFGRKSLRRVPGWQRSRLTLWNCSKAERLRTRENACQPDELLAAAYRTDGGCKTYTGRALRCAAAGEENTFDG